MWTRKEVKERGRAAFKRNYWWCVLVALIFALISGVYSSAGNSSDSSDDDITVNQEYLDSLGEDADIADLPLGELISDSDGNPLNFSFNIGPFSYGIDEMEGMLPVKFNGLLSAVTLKVFGGIIAIAVVATIILSIFVFNPLMQGCRRFMLKNLDEKADFGQEMGGGFKPYGKVVSTLFWRDLYTVLWAFVFIIPAIVKSYSYRMVPYILAEHPEMDAQDIITLSRKMMDGNKFNTFVLDLSFIGWLILDALTFHILGVFYVRPYIMSTDAALYERIRDGYEYANSPAPEPVEY